MMLPSAGAQILMHIDKAQCGIMCNVPHIKSAGLCLANASRDASSAEIGEGVSWMD